MQGYHGGADPLFPPLTPTPAPQRTSLTVHQPLSNHAPHTNTRSNIKAHASPTHQTKIAQLDEGRVCAGDECIGRLDIPEHHLVAVAEGHGMQQLLEEVAGQLLAHMLAANQVSKRATWRHGSAEVAVDVQNGS